MIWREKKILLLVLATILLANVAFFVTYRVRYRERIDELEQRMDQTRLNLEQARRARMLKQAELRDYQKLLADVRTVHEDWWSTPDERLAPLIVEVRRLAETSGLVPRAISYDLEQQKKELGAESMQISFVVTGSYERVRRLINLIELSRQFVMIDAIGIGSSGEAQGELVLNLQLETLFRDPETKVSGRKRT